MIKVWKCTCKTLMNNSPYSLCLNYYSDICRNNVVSFHYLAVCRYEFSVYICYCLAKHLFRLEFKPLKAYKAVTNFLDYINTPWSHLRIISQRYEIHPTAIKA